MQDYVRGALDLTADRRSCMIGGLPMSLELSSAVLRICASSDESLPDPHSIRMIEFKQTDSDTPDGSLRQNVSAIQSKVNGPALRARVEQRSQLPGGWINRSNVGAFAPVAVNAGQRKVFGSGLATMLLRDDVIRLMGKQHIFVAHEAVLATIGGAFPDQLA
jgi:hypothetical protein